MAHSFLIQWLEGEMGGYWLLIHFLFSKSQVHQYLVRYAAVKTDCQLPSEHNIVLYLYGSNNAGLLIAVISASF
jgi:hypothetical protein